MKDKSSSQKPPVPPKPMRKDIREGWRPSKPRRRPPGRPPPPPPRPKPE